MMVAKNVYSYENKIVKGNLYFKALLSNSVS